MKGCEVREMLERHRFDSYEIFSTIAIAISRVKRNLHQMMKLKEAKEAIKKRGSK
jgi:hypothetical protein